MPKKNPTCRTCALRCDPVNTGEKAGYCYGKDEFVTDLNGHCEKWAGSLRDEPIAPGPMTPEERLRYQVGCWDRGPEE